MGQDKVNPSGEICERRLSIVVPCYNEQDGIVALWERVVSACRPVVGENFELVLVNDGSRDRSWEFISHLAKQDPRVLGVDLSRNFGHQLALTAGLTICRGSRILIIDADLQDPPELLGPMMEMMDQGYDVVYGRRRQRDGETAFKKASSHLFYRILNRLAEVDIPVDTGDFRLMSRRALDVLNSMPEQHRFIRGMVGWIGFRQTEIMYDRAPRVTGTTNYPLAKMLRFAADAITGFSIRPLRLATYLGFICSLMATALMAYILYSFFAGLNISGWTSIALISLAVAALQFFLLGVIGEYLGRLYIESKHRPLYIIREMTGGERLSGPE